MRLAVLLAALTATVALAAPASGSELLQDPNVKLLSLKVNAKGEALLTYRRADGTLRRVLAWGAINARAPSETTPQVRFRWDYAGGWGKYRNGKYWKGFKNRCAAVRRPGAADARRGVQGAERQLLDGAGVAAADPAPRLRSRGSHAQTNWELHLSHFSGELPKLEAFSNWTYGGRWQGIFGRYTYLGQPIFGFGSNAKGVPKDKYGRNLYIDTLNSAYGPGWKRESGILTHKEHWHVLPQLRPAAPVRRLPEPGGAACRCGRALPHHRRRAGCHARHAGRGRRAHARGSGA